MANLVGGDVNEPTNLASSADIGYRLTHFDVVRFGTFQQHVCALLTFSISCWFCVWISQSRPKQRLTRILFSVNWIELPNELSTCVWAARCKIVSMPFTHILLLDKSGNDDDDRIGCKPHCWANAIPNQPNEYRLEQTQSLVHVLIQSSI